MNTKPVSSLKEIDKDGSYIIKEVFEKTTYQRDFLSRIKRYNSDNIWLGGETFKDKEFKELYYNYQIVFLDNEIYQQKAVLKEPNEDNYMSWIIEYDKDNKILNGKYFKDKEFKELRLTITCSYNEDGSYQRRLVLKSYQRKVMFIRLGKNSDMSCIEKYNQDGKILSEKCISRKKLIDINTYHYDPCGIYRKEMVDYILKNSSIEEYDECGRIISKRKYSDNEFKNIISSTINNYNPDGSYCIKVAYEQPDEYNCMSRIEEYDKDKKILNRKHFRDKDFKELFGTSIFEYRENGKLTKEILFMEDEKEHQINSVICNYKENSIKPLSEICYTDNQFKNEAYAIYYNDKEDEIVISNKKYIFMDKSTNLILLTPYEFIKEKYKEKMGFLNSIRRSKLIICFTPLIAIVLLGIFIIYHKWYYLLFSLILFGTAFLHKAEYNDFSFKLHFYKKYRKFPNYLFDGKRTKIEYR